MVRIHSSSFLVHSYCYGTSFLPPTSPLRQYSMFVLMYFHNYFMFTNLERIGADRPLDSWPTMVHTQWHRGTVSLSLSLFLVSSSDSGMPKVVFSRSVGERSDAGYKLNFKNCQSSFGEARVRCLNRSKRANSFFIRSRSIRGAMIAFACASKKYRNVTASGCIHRASIAFISSYARCSEPALA